MSTRGIFDKFTSHTNSAEGSIKNGQFRETSMQHLGIQDTNEDEQNQKRTTQKTKKMRNKDPPKKSKVDNIHDRYYVH